MEHHPTQSLTIEVAPDAPPDVKIIKLSGPMTIHNFFDFQELTRQKPFPKFTLVDVKDVPYIDSAALGSFVGLHVSCEASGRKYALVGSNDRLRSLYQMTHVESFLSLYDSLEEAQSKLL